MSETVTAGLDLAMAVLQVHGADGADWPSCVAAMKGCGDARGGEMGKLGHDVRCIPSACVKPFVTRQKSDMADAEASSQAAHDALCSGEERGDPRRGNGLSRSATLIRQRMPAINALRDHLTAFGQIVPEPDAVLLADAIPRPRDLIAALAHLAAKIARAKAKAVARRLMTVPGIGPPIATALAALAPPPETFRNARDCAAWRGLVPGQRSTGGKPCLRGRRRWANVALGRCCFGCKPRHHQTTRSCRGLAPGWQEFHRASHQCWCASRWPTGWRALSER